MTLITQYDDRHEGDDKIDRARSRHEAEPLDHDSPQREHAEGNREILAQLRVRLQDVLGRRAQRVPDAVASIPPVKYEPPAASAPRMISKRAV